MKIKNVSKDKQNPMFIGTNSPPRGEGDQNVKRGRRYVEIYLPQSRHYMSSKFSKSLIIS